MTSVFFAGFAVLGTAMAAGLKVGGVIIAFLVSTGISTFGSAAFFVPMDYWKTDKEPGWVVGGMFLGLLTWALLLAFGPRIDVSAQATVVILRKAAISTLTSSAAIALFTWLIAQLGRYLLNHYSMSVRSRDEGRTLTEPAARKVSHDGHQASEKIRDA